MDFIGSSTGVPENWNKWWIFMWGVTAPAVIVLAFFLPFWWWVGLALVGFLLPEIVNVVKKDDSLPQRTHTIRHFLRDWLAFPFIYFCLGSIGAHWLDFSRPIALGLLFALLGWLTDPFSVTYAQPAPFPFTDGRDREGAWLRSSP